MGMESHILVELDVNGKIVTTKYNHTDYGEKKKKKPEFSKIVRLEHPSWIETFCKMLNYDMNNQEWNYELRFEDDDGGDDGNNLPQIEKFVKWKTHEDNWIVIVMHYATIEVKKKIENAIGKKLGQSNWIPKRPPLKQGDYWISKSHCPLKNKYPIYIISKGRWIKKLTYDAIKEMNVDFKIVVETDEIEKYVKHGVDLIDILEFNKCEKKRFTLTGEGGSIPVRNFIKEHSIKNGFKNYWCLDDNIKEFLYQYKNCRLPIKTGVIFRAIEDYVDCCKNVKMSGMNYKSFFPEISKRRWVGQINSRIYSCILVSNAPEMYWRGTYNEDTDLSLRVLKSGGATIYFNCFLADKQKTMSCTGGNTDTIYQGDGLKKKAESIVEQHPDVATITHNKFKREYHHNVNYKPFIDNPLEIIDNLDHIDSKNYELLLVTNI